MTSRSDTSALHVSASAAEAITPTQALHALVLSLSHGLESLRRQLHEQHAAGEALRADLAAQSDANTALLGDADALRSMLADLEAEAQAQRGAAVRLQAVAESHAAINAELQARVTSLEAQIQALRILVASPAAAAPLLVNQPTDAPPAAEPAEEPTDEPLALDPQAVESPLVELHVVESHIVESHEAESPATELPVVEPPAAPARAAVVMPPMRLNADATNLWDRLPDDVHSKIVDLAGDLTKLANGLLHPFEIVNLHYERLERLWLDVFASDWQGDLLSLPKGPVGIEHGICTRGMLVRMGEIGRISPKTAIHVIVANKWDDMINWQDENVVILVACAAAECGRADLLREIFEVRRLVPPTPLIVSRALGSGHLAVADMLLELRDRLYPNVEIPDILRDPSVRDLLRKPPKRYDFSLGRVSALDCLESQTLKIAAQAARLGDVPALEVLQRRFGRKIDFSKLPYYFSTVEMLEWAYSRSFIRNPAETLCKIMLIVGGRKSAQWMCRVFGLVLEQVHLFWACLASNGPMVSWLLTMPGIGVNRSVVTALVNNCSLTAIDAMIAHDPALAIQIANTAVSASKLVAYSMHAKRQGAPSPRELVEWLYARHPSGFTPGMLVIALQTAIDSEYVDTVAFLLESVTTIDWDLGAARLQISGSGLPKKRKRQLMSFVTACASSRAPPTQ